MDQIQFQNFQKHSKQDFYFISALDLPPLFFFFFLFSFFGVRKCETLLADSLSHSAYPYMNELKQKKKKRVRALGKT